MNRRIFAPVGTALLSMVALLVLLLAWVSADAPVPAQAAPIWAPARGAPTMAVPTVTEVSPTSAPNDLATPIVITGTGFTTGSLVLLGGDAPLDDVGWVSSATLTATVPWGMAPDVYTVTVFNPGEGSGSLPNAFTVTQGLGVWTTEGPYGGYVDGIEKKPGTPTTVYALASGTGLFVSEDAGEWWELVYSVDWMTHLAFDSQDADVMYLGTWRSNQYARSLDGGQTWETIPQIGFPGDGTGMSSPATHPTDAGTVFLGIGHPSGELPPGKGGVFRSDDYGMTWITKTNGMTDTDVQSIAIHPNDPAKMLAGTWDGNLYVSTDGGENWSLNAHLDGPVSAVYFDPYQPLEAWASASVEVHGAPYLYTSTNLADWTPVVIDPGQTIGSPRWNLTFLTDTIWASSVAAYTSTDDGVSWTGVSGLHRGANAVAVTSENPQEVYVGTEEGVDKSQDGGQTWQPIDEGLAGVVPYAIAVARTDPDTVYVAADPHGILRSFNGGHAWQDVMEGGAGGWGEWLVADAYTPTRVYLGGRRQYTDALCIEISADAAETWHLVTATLPVTYAGWESAAYALVSHPQAPGRLLAGAWLWPPGSAPWLEDTLSIVYASDDHGQSWTQVGPTQPVSPVMDIAYDAVDPDLVYMATAGSGLWRSVDGGNTWQVMPGPGGRSIVNEIAPHPTISGYLVVAAATTGECGLFSSQDAGETWTLLHTNVQNPVVYAPTVPPVLYARIASGQQWGFVRSDDGGQTWELIEDMPQPTSLAAATDGERVVVYVGTPGGVVQIDLEDALLGAGVYRWSSLLPTPRLYLPLAFKDHGYFSLRSK